MWSKFQNWCRKISHLQVLFLNSNPPLHRRKRIQLNSNIPTTQPEGGPCWDWEERVESEKRKIVLLRLSPSSLPPTSVCDVPVKNCGILTKVFARILCNAQLASAPSPATCAQMAYKLGVITTTQLVERMLMVSEPICLSWVATMLDVAHINEVRLTVNKLECPTLDVLHIPGGKASDYVLHIISSLT